jgi:hypothetical protein
MFANRAEVDAYCLDEADMKGPSWRKASKNHEARKMAKSPYIRHYSVLNRDVWYQVFLQPDQATLVPKMG